MYMLQALKLLQCWNRDVFIVLWDKMITLDVTTIMAMIMEIYVLAVKIIMAATFMYIAFLDIMVIIAFITMTNGCNYFNSHKSGICHNCCNGHICNDTRYGPNGPNCHNGFTDNNHSMGWL